MLAYSVWNLRASHVWPVSLAVVLREVECHYRLSIHVSNTTKGCGIELYNILTLNAQFNHTCPFFGLICILQWNLILCWCHTECDSATVRVLVVGCVLAHWMHGMCASWHSVYREGLKARQWECDVTGVLRARGSAHCALGFEPSLCPACHGRCAFLCRQGAGPPPLLADSLVPSCGHL